MQRISKTVKIGIKGNGNAAKIVLSLLYRFLAQDNL
jgi:hypothetical protein